MESEIKTFDEKSIDSVDRFADQLMNIDDRDVNNDFLILNILKATEVFKSFNEDDYKQEITGQLLRVLQNLTFFYCSEDVIKEMIKSDFEQTICKITDFYLKQNTFSQNDFRNLSRVFSILNLLAGHSEIIVTAHVENGLHQKALNLLRTKSDFQLDKLKHDASFCLYDTVLRFLLTLSSYIQVNEALIGVGLLPYSFETLKNIETSQKPRYEFKHIKLHLISIIANLLNDSQLDTLPVTQEIVDMFIEVLKEIVEKSSTNTQILNNTKYYTTYTIEQTDIYTYFVRFSRRLIRIAVNDTMKQKLFDKGILNCLEDPLKNGNNDEKEICSELICGLCFNENAAKYVREKESLLNAIKSLSKDSTNESTKSSCIQIIEMVNQTLKKRASSAKTNQKTSIGHIMISYNHKIKDKCLELNEELIKRGYKTWMDVNSVFTDLHDAIATAIENSSVFLLCYSYDYKISNNCRLEAQYAFKINKNILALKMQPSYEPDGWLGLIVASKLYIDFCKPNVDKSSVYNNLCKQIDLVFHKITTDRPSSSRLNSESKIAVQTLDRPPSRNITTDQAQRPPSRNISSATKRYENAKNWNKDEVKNWLLTNDMESLAGVFKNYSGITMKGLFELKKKDYAQFCNFVDEEIKESNVKVERYEKLNFYELLERLFNN